MLYDHNSSVEVTLCSDVPAVVLTSSEPMRMAEKPGRQAGVHDVRNSDDHAGSIERTIGCGCLLKQVKLGCNDVEGNACLVHHGSNRSSGCIR